MSTQPKPLFLADALDHGVGTINRDRHKAAAELRRLHAENEALRADAERWQSLYRKAVNVANGLTNYIEDRPELRQAERQLDAIQNAARSKT